MYLTINMHMSYWDAYMLPVSIRKYLVNQHIKMMTPKEINDPNTYKKPTQSARPSPFESRPHHPPVLQQTQRNQ